MNETIKILPNFKKFQSYIKDVKENINPVMLSGLTDVGKVHFSYATKFYVEKPICIITYNEMQAKKLIKDLEYFTEKVEYFPKREILTYEYLAESKDVSYQRISCLNNIYTKKAKIIVTTIEAVSQKIIEKKALYKNVLNFSKGKIIDLAEIKSKLTKLGYERCDMVEGKSQFSVRGGIIDIAFSEKQGVRIELWGDEIDSIRYFDIISQRSIDEKIEKVKVYPSHEFILEENINYNEFLAEDLEEIKNGDYLNKVDKYFNVFYREQGTLIDYIKDDYIIFLDEIGKIKVRLENVIKDTQSVKKNLMERGRTIPQSLNNIENYLNFGEKIKQIQTIYLEKQDIGFVDKQSMHAKRNGYSFSYREVNFFRSSMDLLLEEVQKGVKSNKDIVILCGSTENIKKTKKILENIGSQAKITYSSGYLSTGFECYDFNLLVISVAEVFATNKKRKKTAVDFKQGETVMFSELKVGDYIVHRTNGIGQFTGVNTIKADGITKDYIKIKYKDDDVLYIPTNNLDSIRRYIGAGNREPKVNRLGSKEWSNAKAKVKSNLKEVARDLIELYAKREKQKGFIFSKDLPWQKEFEDNFEFQETVDQLRAIEELKKDMEKDKPMDRLLCGDVRIW